MLADNVTIDIALEAHHLDLILYIYKFNGDISYAIDSVTDKNSFSSYRNEVLQFVLPLFPALVEAKAPHVNGVTRLLIMLGDASLALPFLTTLVQKETLLVYQT